MERNEAFERVLDELCVDPAVEVTQMMGMRSAKLGGKLFCGVRQGELVVRLGRARVDELVAAERAERFDPMGGRPMKDWASVPEPADDWLALADEAKRWVRP